MLAGVIDGHTLREAHLYDAHYVMLEARGGYWGNGMQQLSIGDCSVPAHGVYYRHLNVTAYYVSVRERLANTAGMAKLAWARVQYGPDLYPYGGWSETEVLAHAFYVTCSSMSKAEQPNGGRQLQDYPKLCSVIWGNRKLPLLRITGSHLRHVSVHELKFFKREDVLRRAWWLLPTLERWVASGIHESMWCGMLVWALALPPAQRVLAEQSTIWAALPNDAIDVAKYIKSHFSSRLKALQNNVSVDLTPFFELEVLVNRGLGEVDWVSERRHRTQPDLCKLSTDMIYSKAIDLFTRAQRLGSRPRRYEWTTFWADRWRWAPTGTSHSQYKEDAEYVPVTRELRTKMYTMCAQGARNYSWFAQREPCRYVWPMTKYEWGKQRAIYSIDDTAFIMSSFAMAGCEEVLGTLFPVGDMARADHVALQVKEVLRNGVPFCFDFEDFNSQHTGEAQSAVIRAYLRVFHERLSTQQHDAGEWVAQSYGKTVIQCTTGTYTATDTLMSGDRLTTFLNTVLNRIYVEVAMEGTPFVATHNGDDVLMAARTFAQVQTLMRGSARINVRFQPAKCHLAGAAEFLRVDHARGSSGAQYLARAVATLVHGQTQSIIPNDLTAVLQAIDTRAKEFVERSQAQDVADVLVEAQLTHISKLWDTSIDDLRIAMKTHASRGGLSTQVSRDAASHTIERIATVLPTNADTQADLDRAMPGAADYASKLARNLFGQHMIGRIARAAKSAITHSAMVKRFGIAVKTAKPDVTSLLHMHKYGSLRAAVGVNKLLLARAYNLPLLAGLDHTAEVTQELAYETDLVSAVSLML